MSSSAGIRRGDGASRFAVPVAVMIFVLLGTILYAIRLRHIIPTGAPATVILGVGFYLFMKYHRLPSDAAVEPPTAAEGDESS